MQFMVLTERRLDQFPLEAFTPELGELEAQRVRALYTAGSIRSIWRRKDMPGAVILLEAADEDEVRVLVGSLPLAERGMLRFAVVTGLEPYPGFAPR
jgi:muconolactone delta-isomerase